jgi:hypothetical protein
MATYESADCQKANGHSSQYGRSRLDLRNSELIASNLSHLRFPRTSIELDSQSPDHWKCQVSDNPMVVRTQLITALICQYDSRYQQRSIPTLEWRPQRSDSSETDPTLPYTPMLLSESLLADRNHSQGNYPSWISGLLASLLFRIRAPGFHKILIISDDFHPGSASEL